MFGTVPLKGYYSFPLDPRLVLWLDSSRINGVNTALPSNGASVSVWRDISGWGNDFVQATGANQPTFTTGAINGLPSVTFNNANSQFMTAVANSATLNPNLCSQFSVIQTFEWPATGASNINFIFSRVGNVYRMYLQGASSNLRVQYINTSSTTGFAGTIAPAINTTYVLSGVWDGTTITATANTSSNTAALSGTILQNTSGNCIGRDQTNANRYWNGYIAEILIYNSNLSASEMTSVRKYLGNKYNATVI